MVSSQKPKLYNIPAREPFLRSLAIGILDRVNDSQQNLSRVNIFLPTRNACRVLRRIFLEISNEKSTLLPNINALGDIDIEDVNLGTELAENFRSDLDIDSIIPPAISIIKRQILLAKLVMARGGLDEDQAIRLASELADLLDQIHTERLALEDLRHLAPDEYTVHWQEVLEFLKILIDSWPSVLKEERLLDPTERRNKVLEAIMHAWDMAPPEGPVFAAGSTGSIPVTADLLNVISRMPNGAVILPGLDLKSPQNIWRQLDPQHPQYGLAQLLNHIGADRKDVKDWQISKKLEIFSCKENLINLSFRSPSDAEIKEFTLDLAKRDLKKFSQVDCSSAREEAGVIAIAIRHVLETPKKTVALVTPDRYLARRVISELKRWDILVEDLAGTQISNTPVGAFIQLIGRMVSENFAPISLLAVLKNPLASGGMERKKFLRLVQDFEKFVLRGPRPEGGIKPLRILAEKHKQETSNLTQLVNILERIFLPVLEESSKPKSIFSNILKVNLLAAEQLAATNKLSGAERLWSDKFGQKLALFFSSLIQETRVLNNFNPSHYPSVLDGLLRSKTVSPDIKFNERVSIWGLMEARLQRADMMILSGLNEGSWPPEIKYSPWMSRPMMARFGLSPPDRRIGLNAHDFYQGCAAEEVLLTRSMRVKGAPSIPCRWLIRLENFLSVTEFKLTSSRGKEYLAWFSKLDSPKSITPILPPAPTPPVHARPKLLPVTRIETLIRDPYSIYAEKILNLKPLEPLDADPSLAERGTLIHKALEKFLSDFSEDISYSECLRNLVSIGKEIFDNSTSYPGVRAFWWPRFLRVAEWFVDFEINRRKSGIRNLLTETEGKIKILSDTQAFTLTARIDRVDCFPDGSLAIVDYKTGVPPSSKQVKSGLAPQLPLEALIIRSGGVEKIINKVKISEISYIHLSGGRQPGENKTLNLDIEEAMDSAFSGLCNIIHRFNLIDTPYLSRPRPQFKSRFNVYDHLARVKEWGSISLGEDTE